MADNIKKYLNKDVAFWVCLIASVTLLFTSFFIPPLAFIDGSVLAAVGELFGFATLGEVAKAIAYGRKVSLQHGNTSVVIKNEEDADILDQDQINNEVEDEL